MTTAPRAGVEEVDAHPESPVTNAQPAGIGRVACLGDVCAWNNLGRNIVFADARLRPVGIFAETLYPDNAERSEYDLDVHAIVAMPEVDLVLALNHLGVLRAFGASELRARTTDDRAAPARLSPHWTSYFADDVERAVVVGDRLIGSRPRRQGALGVVVSEPIRGRLDGRDVGADVDLESWGEVTALGWTTVRGHAAIVVGGLGRVAAFPMAGGRVGPPSWEVAVDLRAATIVWDGRLVWVAGSAPSGTHDDYDWEKARGGEFAGLEPATGAVAVSGRVPDEIAWGNGGVPIVLVDDALWGVGRTGRVHRLTGNDRGAPSATPPPAVSSLGIAHAAAVAGRVLYGFNRGGYRLHVVDPAAARPTTPPQLLG